jgi:hypothetical protein
MRRWFCELAIGSLILGIPLSAAAANQCPWLNEATAGGLLGGDAVGTFTAPTAASPAVCTFVETGTNFKRTLTITVEVTSNAHTRVESLLSGCDAGMSPIKAIGNEAAICEAGNRKGARFQRVIGRVRDQVFVIAFDTTLKTDPLLTPESLPAKIYTAAEQVSGNLF